MPLHPELSNIIIPKEIIEKKYHGGIIEFRKWFDENKGSRWQEDKECFLIAQMECNMHYIDFLFEQGLHYDYDTNSSVDFACVKRYGGAIWEAEWLRYNDAYIWHKDCHKDKVAYAEKINNMKMEDIAEAIERGENIWDTIW